VKHISNAMTAVTVWKDKTGRSLEMYHEEKILLQVEKASKQYGKGCEFCSDNKTKNLEKNYCPECGTVYALRDISFDLYQGEILGVVGESGSGKSTLMQCLYFDQGVSSGAVFLDSYEKGKTNLFEISDQAKRYIRNYKLGKVYQNPLLGLKMSFSSVSNIAEKMISAGHRKVSGMIDRAESLLDHVNIPANRTKEPPKKFSGGMQQRVQIAKALSNNPSILLMDEITSGLDLSVQAKVLDLIKEIRQQPEGLFEMIRANVKETVGQYLSELMDVGVTALNDLIRITA